MNQTNNRTDPKKMNESVCGSMKKMFVMFLLYSVTPKMPKRVCMFVFEPNKSVVQIPKSKYMLNFFHFDQLYKLKKHTVLSCGQIIFWAAMSTWVCDFIRIHYYKKFKKKEYIIVSMLILLAMVYITYNDCLTEFLFSPFDLLLTVLVPKTGFHYENHCRTLNFSIYFRAKLKNPKCHEQKMLLKERDLLLWNYLDV